MGARTRLAWLVCFGALLAGCSADPPVVYQGYVESESADPDVIWERIKNDGPGAVRQVVPAEPPLDPKPPGRPH